MTSTGSFSLPSAEIISLFLESLFFGAFGVLYAISIWILMYRAKRRKTKQHKWMFATATTMFVLALAHMIFDVQRALDGFVNHGGTPTGTYDFYSWISNPTHVAKSAIYITQTLVGDGFVTYRLYIVYGRTWHILVLPLALLFGTAIAGYGICYELTQVKGIGAIFESNLEPWITSFFALSLTTNVIATMLIIGRIVWSNRNVRKYRAGYAAALTHWGVIETIVQSAAIYSAALASLLGTYVAGSNAQYVCLDSLQPLIGIVFTLIIIRVGLGEMTSSSSRSRSYSRGPNPAGDSRISALPGPTRSVAINVSVTRTHDRPSFEEYEMKDGDLGRGQTEVESAPSTV